MKKNDGFSAPENASKWKIREFWLTKVVKSRQFAPLEPNFIVFDEKL
jgi:hypothetical protein